jgi:ABC-type nitrate/sulfonate/bicarbonate transport system substrate-binding protein
MAQSADRNEKGITSGGGGGFSRRNLLRGGVSVAAAGAFGAFLAACSSSSSSSSSAASSPSTGSAGSSSPAAAANLGSLSLQLGWIAGAGYAGSFIADTKGFYTKQGVKVSILPGGPSVSGMPLLISNKVQVAISDPETVSAAITQGGDVKIIAAGYPINPACIMSLASNPITKPADLKGKTIGVGAADDAEWAAFLKVNNIASSELTTVPASFDPSPLAAGKWDGYLAFLNNEVPQFAAKGIKTAVLRFADFGMPSYNDVYAVTGAALANATTRKQIVAFLAGEIEGWTMAVQDPKLGAQLVVDDYGKNNGYTLAGQILASEATNAVSVDADTKANGLLHMSAAGIKGTINTLALTGVKASASMFDTSVLADAHALVQAS